MHDVNYFFDEIIITPRTIVFDMSTWAQYIPKMNERIIRERNRSLVSPIAIVDVRRSIHW